MNDGASVGCTVAYLLYDDILYIFRQYLISWHFGGVVNALAC
jgi:hypothetical protein